MTTKNETLFIGIDDTDFGESIGTGALARELNLHLQREVEAESLGITRHQFLVHPDIPYTSHNSAACLEIRVQASLAQVTEICRQFVMFLYHEGADPGLCVTEGELSRSVLDFGLRAQREVVTKAEALELGRKESCILYDLGGEGIGVIGAIAACALRQYGNDGRFISLKGIRDLDGAVSVAHMKEMTPIERVIDSAGVLLGPDALVDTKGWVRPDLIEGKITLRVGESGQNHYETPRKTKGHDSI